LDAYAFWCLFEGPTSSYNIVPFIDTYEFRDLIKGSYQYRIQSEMISIALGKQVRLPIFGNFFVECKGTGTRLFVSLDLAYESSACCITVLVAPQHAAQAEQFLCDMDASIQANDIYYKKCLSYECGKIDFYAVSPTSWSSIIMKEDLKENIRQNTVGVLENMEILTGIGMCPNRNLMLISPPGMAKTMTFRAISCEIEGQMTRIWCTGKSIEYPEHVTKLFEAARALAPCVIFLEDLDLTGGERSSSRGDPRVLNELLQCLDGAQENAGVVVIASTNDASALDEAILNRPGRFDVKIEVPLPDAADRREMLNKFFLGYHATFDPSVTMDTIKTILDMTEGLTGDYMKNLAKTTVVRAVANGSCDGKNVIINSDHITGAADQAMKNFAIGKRAKRHHHYEDEVSSSV
jgi:AAA+ superfamily predicted ATPase